MANVVDFSQVGQKPIIYKRSNRANQESDRVYTWYCWKFVTPSNCKSILVTTSLGQTRKKNSCCYIGILPIIKCDSYTRKSWINVFRGIFIIFCFSIFHHMCLLGCNLSEFLLHQAISRFESKVVGYQHIMRNHLPRWESSTPRVINYYNNVHVLRIIIVSLSLWPPSQVERPHWRLTKNLFCHSLYSS